MSFAVFETDVPFDYLHLRVAAVLCRVPQRNNLHIGLLYRGSDDTCQALHLGWQDTIFNTWTFPKLWASLDVDQEKLIAIAGLCRLIWTRYQEDRTFPYALEDLGASFDHQGRLVLADGANGLTCATFVVHVFRRGGVTLVDRDTWPIRKELDEQFLRFIEEAGFAQPAHLSLLRSEVAKGVRRVHPDEVVAACSRTLPAKFRDVRRSADAVVAKLDGKARLRGWRRHVCRLFLRARRLLAKN